MNLMKVTFKIRDGGNSYYREKFLVAETTSEAWEWAESFVVDFYGPDTRVSEVRPVVRMIIPGVDGRIYQAKIEVTVYERV